MEWLGVTVLAVVAAVSGGTLRDLLLGKFPGGWIQNPWQWPVWLALGPRLRSSLRHTASPQRNRLFRVVLIADAAGLATCAVTGSLLALAADVSGPVAVLLGVVSGTAGGVVRNVLAGQRPLIPQSVVHASPRPQSDSDGSELARTPDHHRLCYLVPAVDPAAPQSGRAACRAETVARARDLGLLAPLARSAR